MPKRIETLGQPDYTGQIYALGQRLAAVEARLSGVETIQASTENRLDVIEDGGVIPPVPVLGNLTLSAAIVVGSASNGTIAGATNGSTIASNVSGLTVNSVARTYTWSGTGAAGTTANGLVETLIGAVGSPKSSAITVVASGAFAAPTVTITDDTVNPPEFEVDTGDAVVGDTLRLTHANNSAFTSPTVEDHVLTSDDLVDGSINWTTFTGFAGGSMRYWNVSVVRGGTVLGTSNTVSATIVSAPPVNANVIVQEGDSITAWTGGHADRYASANPSLTRYKLAVGGNGLSNLIARQSTARGYDAEIVTVLIGANDLSSGSYASGTAYFNAVMAYIAPFKTDGAKVVVGTILPKGTVNSDYVVHNSRRAEFNALLKAAQGSQVDAVADYDSTVLGTDAAANDLTLYGDGLHPTDGTGTPTSDGHGLYMLPQYAAAINFARGVANQVKQFTFTDASGVTAGATSTSNTVKLLGLGYTESKPYTVTGGEVSKNGGAWSTSGGSIVNGDTLAVRGTASATAGGSVNVVLTVGTVSDTYTITTSAGAQPLTTTYRNGAAGNGGFANSFTFSSVAFYAGKNVIAIMNATGAVAPSSVVLGGTSGTKVAEVVTGQRNLSFWEVSKGSGGSGNLAVAGGPIFAIGYALWSTDATATFDSFQSLAYDYRNDPTQTPAVTLPDGGSILWCASSEAAAATIAAGSGTTLDAQFADPDNWKFGVGRRATTGAPAVTGLAFAGSNMLAVAYKP